jgi:anion-transporting  ArsA/GET3 family ATPase
MEAAMLSILGKRLLLVSGKGGVGKSACVAALARLARARGLRVLAAEVDTRPVLPTFLAAPALAHPVPDGELRPVEDGLATVNLDHTSSVVFWLKEHLPVPRLLKAVVANPIIGHFLRAAPSVTEMAVLNRSWRLVRDMERGELPFDLLLLDLPALGHAHQLLKVPTILAELVKAGPAARRAREVDQLLRDPGRTALTLVSLAEEMPVSETIQLGQRIAREAGVPVQQLLVNQVTPPLLAEGSAAPLLGRIDARMNGRQGSLAELIAAGLLREQRAHRHREQVERLRRSLPGIPLATLPLLLQDDGPAGLVRNLAYRLAEVPT